MGHYSILQKDIINIIYRIVKLRHLTYFSTQLHESTKYINERCNKHHYYRQCIYIFINGHWDIGFPTRYDYLKWKFNKKGHRIMA